jgi:hypothetical protein
VSTDKKKALGPFDRDVIFLDWRCAAGWELIDLRGGVSDIAPQALGAWM